MKFTAGMSLLEWASDESDHIKELYTRLADLEALHAKLYKRYTQQIESARQCYKAIAKGEKHLQDVKKEYEVQQVRANKVRKQVRLFRITVDQIYKLVLKCRVVFTAVEFFSK